jgi:esterase/lipase
MEILKFGEAKIEGGSLVYTLFLHGFPSIRSRQNRDIAEATARETGGRADVLLYDGLGFSPGVFSFERCLSDVRAFVKNMVESGVEKFDLVGHSWGGFLSLVLASEFRKHVRRMVLMSPLLSFTTAEHARPWFEETFEDNPHIRLGNIGQLATEFERLGKKYPLQNLLSKFPETVDALFLQAENDDVTPSSIAKSSLAFFSKTPLFELADTDHSFLINRPAMTDRIARFIAR